ncbi:hypothetical protein BOX15_Mlig018393g1 [Macrostomum lignano]|uniref:Death domain-containing protein n=1 Tax=Macrostomum lignano TaxID=282301 RepID=A0A267DKA6_9PLAT|nr:hypothetical protein BOX15_Mlig018393g1 [Macrostomum lignano]
MSTETYRNMSLYGNPYPEQIHEIPLNLMNKLCKSLDFEDKKDKLSRALGYERSQFRQFERHGLSFSRSLLQDWSCRRGSIKVLYTELVRAKLIEEALMIQPYVRPVARIKIPVRGWDKETSTEDLGFDLKYLVVRND